MNIATQALKRKPLILVASESFDDVVANGKYLASQGYEENSPLSQSDVTGDYYQWWRLPHDVAEKAE